MRDFIRLLYVFGITLQSPINSISFLSTNATLLCHLFYVATLFTYSWKYELVKEQYKKSELEDEMVNAEFVKQLSGIYGDNLLMSYSQNLFFRKVHLYYAEFGNDS